MRVTVSVDPGLAPDLRRAARRASLAELLRRCGDELGLPPRGSLAVLLTGDARLRDLNRSFRGDDVPTDVLAFPAGPPASLGHLGDIAISVERAVEQATGDPGAELRLLAVHGLLHCLGHDHGEQEEAALMTELTRRLLPGAGVPDVAAALGRDRAGR